MKNLAMAKKLESCYIDADYMLLGYGYETILIESETKSVKPFAEAVLGGCVNIARALGQRPFSVMHLLGIIITIIPKLVENKWPKHLVISSLDFVTETILPVAISDKKVLSDAIAFFNGEMDDVRRSLR